MTMKRKPEPSRFVFAAIGEAAGISQEALADIAGLRRPPAGSVERGERNLSIDNIEKLANAPRLSPASLMEGTSE